MSSSEPNNGSPDHPDRAERAGNESLVPVGGDRARSGPMGEQSPPQQMALSDRSAAIMRAIAELGETLHTSATYKATHPQEVRKVAGNILIKVIDLILQLYPEHPDWVIPLNQLLYGLRDLDRGKPNILFEPVKLDNRPPNTIADVIFRAIPAAAMTVLMKKARVKRTEAAQTIAGRLNKLGYIDRSGGPIKGIQVAQWREDIMAQRPRELAARRYLDALKEVEALEPQEAVTYLLNALVSLPPPHFPQNPVS